MSDVITNSSSEVFVLTSKYNAKELKKRLISVHENGYLGLWDGSSGMGGLFNIGDWTISYISRAEDLWDIRECMMSGIWEARIADPNDDLTWDHVSKFYEKYSDITKKEFSYTVEEWMKEFDLTEEDITSLIYLDSDDDQKATRAYIKDTCTFLYNEHEEGKLPYPDLGSLIIECDPNNDPSLESLMEINPDFAKYVISQIESSGFETFMDYSNYLK